MRRRYFRFVLYGLACLMTELSTNSRGGDFQAVGPEIPGDSGVAADRDRVQPRPDEVLHRDSEPDQNTISGPSETRFSGQGRRDIIPPGTLGQTYLRVSHPVPLDKHPRTGMLAVRDNGTIPYLTVGIMGGVKMKNGIWLFESTRPLDPGACQIVRVEARETPQDVAPYATRFVRLIPGRIVYLDF